MASMYVGFFQSKDGYQYKVEIGTGSTMKEYSMGLAPFVVSYNTSESPFDPVRLSTASINFLIKDACSGGTIPFSDVLPNAPTDTPVVLYKISGSTESVEWRGFLNTNIITQNWEDNVYEITLQASDIISVLQHIDYHTHGNNKSIVRFIDILRDICEITGAKRLCYSDTKELSGSSTYSLMNVSISEQNWYTSDTDESDKYYNVLEEICKYMGYTAMQYEGDLHLVDLYYYKSHDNLPTRVSVFNGTSWSTETTITYARYITIDDESFLGGGNSISMCPIYKSVKVNDNFYDCDYLIPDIFNEDYLTNRYGQMWDLQGLSFDRNATGFTTTSGGQQKAYSEETNNDMVFRRLYNNKYYRSRYYNRSLTEQNLSGSTASSAFTDYLGATIVGQAVIDNGYNPYAEGYEVPSSINFDNYLMICCADLPNNKKFGEVFDTWRNGGASPRSKLNATMFPSDFKKELFTLNSGYTNPIITDSSTYAVLNLTAIYQKYWKIFEAQQRPTLDKYAYLNPNFKPDGIGKNEMNVLEHKGFYVQMPPVMLLKFAVGNRWWNGTGWTSTECAFLVDLSRNSEDGNYTYADWSSDLQVLNNIRFDDWGGLGGYKMKFDNTISLKDEIKFAVCVPSKMVGYMNSPSGAYTNDWPTDIPDSGTQRTYAGVNGYVWIKDLSVKITCSGNEIGKKYDVLYTNEYTIDDDSVNELPDITFKITTIPDINRLSYSNAGLTSGGYLKAVNELSMHPTTSRKWQKPEQNLIEKYVSQYSTKTIELEYSLKNNISPLHKLNDDWLNKNFVILGNEIDYRNNTNKVKLIEIK